MRRLKTWQRLLLVLALTPVAAEIGLRIAGRVVLETTYSHTVNDPPREGDLVVLCIGESTTAGLWVESHESYPKQLEKRLKDHYAIDRIRVVAPPHLGQNSSQQLNRMDDYFDRYSPALMILMSGANNEWAFSESNIVDFLPDSAEEKRRIRTEILLDSFRLYRLGRRLILQISGEIGRFENAGNENAVWGHPTKTPWPPPSEVRSFAKKHRAAFVEQWFYDQKEMIRKAARREIPVLLMSYPMRPDFLENGEFAKLAAETGLPFVDNERAFTKLAEAGRGADLFAKDAWHPSAKGYALVADAAFRVIVERRMLDGALSKLR